MHCTFTYFRDRLYDGQLLHFGYNRRGYDLRQVWLWLGTGFEFEWWCDCHQEPLRRLGKGFQGHDCWHGRDRAKDTHHVPKYRNPAYRRNCAVQRVHRRRHLFSLVQRRYLSELGNCCPMHASLRLRSILASGPNCRWDSDGRRRRCLQQRVHYEYYAAVAVFKQ